MNNNDIILGLADVCLYLANIGEKEYSKTVEEACCRLRNQDWIPVSEKLPKKPDGYPKCELRRMYFLVSLESGCVESLGFDFDDNRWHTTGSPVVAWMPLPKPPKG